MTTAPQLIPDRLAELDQIKLDRGTHSSFAAGHCALEVVAWLAGERMTDAPVCVSPVLRAFVVSLNDGWDDQTRQRLQPYLPRLVGTAGDGQDDARDYLALDWLVRVFAPTWLDAAGLTAEAATLRDLPRVTDAASAQRAATPARDAHAKVAAALADSGAAAGNAAGTAAQAAAGAITWAIVWDVAGAIAWDVTWATARDADATLLPTIEHLRTSALDLLGRMIDPSAAVASC